MEKPMKYGTRAITLTNLVEGISGPFTPYKKLKYFLSFSMDVRTKHDQIELT